MAAWLNVPFVGSDMLVPAPGWTPASGDRLVIDVRAGVTAPGSLQFPLPQNGSVVALGLEYPETIVELSDRSSVRLLRSAALSKERKGRLVPSILAASGVTVVLDPPFSLLARVV